MLFHDTTFTAQTDRYAQVSRHGIVLWVTATSAGKAFASEAPLMIDNARIYRQEVHH